MNIPYKNILKGCIDRLREHVSGAGIEKILQEQISTTLPNARREVPLADVGATNIFGESSGYIDIVHGGHGIEVKVIEFPRKNAVPSRALYDIGQLSSDYWRLAHAKKLMSAELIVLLRGALVESLVSESEICREFHNRMYVDFQTSRTFGELAVEANEKHRKRQVSAIKRMGFAFPAKNGRGFTTVVFDEFALVSVHIDK